MMHVKGGATDVTTYFVIRTAADGTATTGATITAIDLQYVRSGAAPAAKVDASALGATDSAHSDNKAIEIDATDAPGLYRVDWPDAAFAAGAREVILSVKLASSFTEHLRVQIDAIDEQVVEALVTDTYAEPTGVPGATLSLSEKLGWLFMALRNKVTVTSSKKTFYDDGDAAEWEKDLSDNGATYTETEGNAI